MKTLEQLAREAGFRVYGDCIVAADGRVSGVATESLARFRAACRSEALEEAAQMRQALELAQELASALEQMKSEIEHSGQTHCLGSCYETAGRVLNAWWPTSAAAIREMK